MPADATICKVVGELFRGVNGFVLPTEDRRQAHGQRGVLIYGELTPEGTGTLLDYLQLGRRDVFYDLGSGVGKVVLQAALTVPLKKCVGIELAASRLCSARHILREARRKKLLKARQCVFRNEDILTADIADATVLYCCSTAFSPWLVYRIARKIAALDRPLTFVSMQSLESQSRRIRLVDKFSLPATWNPTARVWVYRVEPDVA